MILLCVFHLAAGSIAFAQDSTGKKTTTYTISGSVGLQGVMMKGLPGDPVTNNNGSYIVAVNSGWSGTVMPIKEGYSFVPASKVYHNVNSDRTDDNYAAKIITYSISGRVGLAGVEIQGLPGNPISNNEGAYSAHVEYGWAGKVVPTKDGFTFVPAARNYAKVTANLNNEDYAPSSITEGTDVEPEARTEWRFDREKRRWEAARMGRGVSTYPLGVGPVGSRKVLVVPTEEVKPEELAEVMEDLQVMSYILDERFKETRRIQGVFTDFGDFFGRDNRATEATWLQGYGVLFAMEVNFSFSPPPKAQNQQAEPPDKQADSTWQRARQQVFSPGEFPGAEGAGSSEEYNSQMVEELKRDLITTLKHAANIRGLQPDEWVILTLVGGRPREFSGGIGGRMPTMSGASSMSTGSSYGSASSGGTSGYSSGYSTSGGFVGGGVGGGTRGSMGMGGGVVGPGGYGTGMGGGMMGGMGAGSFPSTVLTIRAKKSDVDAFAKGELTFDQFQEKVKVLMY